MVVQKYTGFEWWFVKDQVRDKEPDEESQFVDVDARVNKKMDERH